MKLWFLYALMTAALAAAESSAGGSAGKPAQTIAIPAGAVQTAPYFYSYTDPNGKKWIYRETPFGVVRFAEEAAVAPKAAETDNIKATEDGDAVRFERPGPFGIYYWKRNKSELDADEQAAWDKERARAAVKTE